MDDGLLDAARTGDTSYIEKHHLLRRNTSRVSQVTSGENNILHLAAKAGHTRFISALCDRHASLLFQMNSDGDTPLHCAARGGHSWADLLPGRERATPHINVNWPVLLSIKNRHGNTAVHEALRRGHGGVAVELMEADPTSTIYVASDSDESPLYIAAESALCETVEYMLQFEDASHEGPLGKTALHAATSRSYEVARMLLDRRPYIINSKDFDGSTALHYAASNGDVMMARLLLKHAPSIAAVADNNGYTPLHVAATLGHVHIIREILQSRPDSSEIIDSKGRSFLHTAIEDKKVEVVRYVLKDPMLEELLNGRDKDGNTPLHVAIISRNREVVHMLLRDKRVIRNVTNREGFTPLDLASSIAESSIELRRYKIMEELVSAGFKFSPKRLDFTITEQKRDPDEELNRCRAIANNLALISVLIATVTFSAAFNLPGGYSKSQTSASAGGGADVGLANVSGQAAFQAFLISDTIAMVSSVVIICLLIQTGSWDHDVRLHSVDVSMKLVKLAVGAMVVAFATGTYVVVAAYRRWLALLVCVIVCAVPLVVLGIMLWPFGWMRVLQAKIERVKNVVAGRGRRLCPQGSMRVCHVAGEDYSHSEPPTPVTPFPRIIKMRYFQSPPHSPRADIAVTQV